MDLVLSALRCIDYGVTDEKSVNRWDAPIFLFFLYIVEESRVSISVYLSHMQTVPLAALLIVL